MSKSNFGNRRSDDPQISGKTTSRQGVYNLGDDFFFCAEVHLSIFYYITVMVSVGSRAFSPSSCPASM